jgi:DNA-binding transcriptional regulator YhcF (GntR family)
LWYDGPAKIKGMLWTMIDISLSKASVEPIYQQLARHFRLQIESGRMLPGDRLPPRAISLNSLALDGSAW